MSWAGSTDTVGGARGGASESLDVNVHVVIVCPYTPREVYHQKCIAAVAVLVE